MFAEILGEIDCVDVHVYVVDCTFNVLVYLFAIFMQLDIVGHSGDSAMIPFYNGDYPPSNDKERMDILKVHYSTCSS